MLSKMRRVLGIAAVAAGILFILIGANEADWETQTYMASNRWMEYLATGAALVLIGTIAGGRKHEV